MHHDHSTGWRNAGVVNACTACNSNGGMQSRGMDRHVFWATDAFGASVKDMCEGADAYNFSLDRRGWINACAGVSSRSAMSLDKIFCRGASVARCGISCLYPPRGDTLHTCILERSIYILTSMRTWDCEYSQYYNIYSQRGNSIRDIWSLSGANATPWISRAAVGKCMAYTNKFRHVDVMSARAAVRHAIRVA